MESGSDYDPNKEQAETRKKRNAQSMRKTRPKKKKNDSKVLTKKKNTERMRKIRPKKKRNDSKVDTKQKNTQRMRTQRQKIRDEKAKEKWPSAMESETYDDWNSNAAMCIGALIGSVPVDIRYPPTFGHPVSHLKETCQDCGIVEFMRMLADIRANPRNIDLAYDEVYAKVGWPTLISHPSGHGKPALHLLHQAGFFQSADGQRFKWKSTRSNRFKVRWMDDFLDARAEQRYDVPECEHLGEANIGCFGCSTRLLVNILSSIHKYGTKSKFCALDYTKVKEKLNASALALNLLFDVGFVRSPRGHHFKWEETQESREDVAAALKEQLEWDMSIKQHQTEQDYCNNVQGCRHEIDEDLVEFIGMHGSYVVEEDNEEAPGGTLARHLCVLMRDICMSLDDTYQEKRKYKNKFNH